jgi:putative tryptophan/tyrosine transport system substrate-binding protein
MDTRRRSLLAALGAVIACWPLKARGQQRFRIGLLDTGLGAAFAAPFTRKLTELGYIEGRNLVLERRSADGNIQRLDDLAAELVRERVDLIVTAGTPAGFAAKKATSTIPVVLGANSDPVGVGLVASLAHPGGNLTGNSLMAPDLSAKRLELLRALAPGISRMLSFGIPPIPEWPRACAKQEARPTSPMCCCMPLVRAVLRSWTPHLPSCLKPGPTRF